MMGRVTRVALALIAGLALGSVGASAAVRYVVIPGNNDTVTDVDNAIAGGSLDWSLLTKSDEGDFASLGFSITGDGTTSGTWSSTTFGVNAVVVKGGAEEFLLIDYTMDGTNFTPVFGDNWCSDGTCKSVFDLSQFMPAIFNMGGNNPDLSHLSIYVLRGIPPIPEPATWLLMIAGFGIAGLAFKRRTLHLAA